ncbi:hypothetical protein FB451DRAFT_1193751 [Mycena latifolia]|nr:hypothetical protein FB451DRAFT_1193751 [Mycena latifolia]
MCISDMFHSLGLCRSRAEGSGYLRRQLIGPRDKECGDDTMVSLGVDVEVPVPREERQDNIEYFIVDLECRTEKIVDNWGQAPRNGLNRDEPLPVCSGPDGLSEVGHGRGKSARDDAPNGGREQDFREIFRLSSDESIPWVEVQSRKKNGDKGQIGKEVAPRLVRPNRILSAFGKYLKVAISIVMLRRRVRCGIEGRTHKEN